MHNRTLHVIPWLLLTVLVISLYLPWLWHPTAALSPNNIDLAEWTTLHPASRGSNPPLLPSFFLRSCPGVATVMLALYSSLLKKKVFRLGGGLLAVLLALGMFPPPDFFTVYTADVNYQQQFILGGLTLAAVAATCTAGRWSVTAIWIISLAFSVVGLACAVVGLIQSMSLMTGLGVALSIGAGSILYCGAIVGLLILSIVMLKLARNRT